MIAPRHIQLNPTNVCTRSCSFCSCSERCDGQVLSSSAICEAMGEFVALGAQAVTVTGGGEPLCYPDVKWLFGYLHSLGLRVGLVTNADLIDTVPDWCLRTLTWCRVSLSDEYSLPGLRKAMGVAPRVDWAYSYVLSQEPCYEQLGAAIMDAHATGMTHIRVVSNILDVGRMPSMEEVRSELRARFPRICFDRVIWQDRSEPERGMRDCRIALLKPVLNADGWIYPCCGAQYARQVQDRGLPEEMRLCHYTEIHERWTGAVPFDGTPCVRCYYGGYNRLLSAMCSRLAHQEFV